MTRAAQIRCPDPECAGHTATNHAVLHSLHYLTAIALRVEDRQRLILHEIRALRRHNAGDNQAALAALDADIRAADTALTTGGQPPSDAAQP